MTAGQGECAEAASRWLLIERRDDASLHYAFSNLPPKSSRLAAMRYWHGFPRPAVPKMPADGFLSLERLRLRQQQPEGPAPALKKAPRDTVPTRSYRGAFFVTPNALLGFLQA